MGRFHRRVESVMVRLLAVLVRWALGACIVMFVAAVIWGFALDGGTQETNGVVMRMDDIYWRTVSVATVLLGYPLGAIVLREP
ncbi:MAG TPA: hypothetical protein VJK08_01585 [Patescibacteria group bacterium]|nr:hypothetical protein [Patescibacteria group bacterium]